MAMDCRHSGCLSSDPAPLRRADSRDPGAGPMTLVTIALMVAAALGAGGSALALLRMREIFSPAERAAIAFVVGTGILGWIGFFIGAGGLMGGVSLAAVCLLLLPGIVFLRGGNTAAKTEPPTLMTWFLLAGVAAALAFDLAEGLSPPNDADTAAYHFALPKLYLEAGRLVFVPRMYEAVSPLLQQMTYAMALGLGGERALTLWTMATGWAAPALLYLMARRHLDRDWSLALALLFLTIPAIVIGGGTGHVEPRNTAFALGAAFGLVEALRRGNIGAAALAGLCAGFFAASKYPGLLFVFAAGIVLLVHARRVPLAVAFAGAAALAGGQWYVWNWWHTGDPVAPMLFGILEYRPDFPWNAEQNAQLKEIYTASERALPPTLWNALTYPFLATLWPVPAFSSERAGFGPFVLLLLPAALAGAWSARDRLLRSPLFALAVVTAVFYFLWFLFGPSQRVRHFLPVYPFLMLAVAVAARSGIAAHPALRTAVGAAFAAVIMLQLAAHALFARPFIQHLASGEDREAFLGRTVSVYDLVTWANANLAPSDRLFMLHREIVYYFRNPVFFGHDLYDARIGIAHHAADPPLFWSQLRKEKITHVVFAGEPDAAATAGHAFLFRSLIARGCFGKIARIPVASHASRTFAEKGSWTESATTVTVYKLQNDACPELS
ncbi:MAG: hypothetical protein EXR04_07485 [Rhodospirillales bacterium]|nr:hypothetical protein [Rhodospirillales bacterium]